MVKRLPKMWGSRAQSLGQEALLEKAMATHSPVLLPGKSHGWRKLGAYSPWAHKESDVTEQLHFHFHPLVYCFIDFFRSSMNFISSGWNKFWLIFLLAILSGWPLLFIHFWQNFYVALEYSWLTVLVSEVQQTDACISSFQVIFPFSLLQNIEQHSLCYTVGPCWFFVLNIAVCNINSNSESVPPVYPGNHQFVL